MEKKGNKCDRSNKCLSFGCMENGTCLPFSLLPSNKTNKCDRSNFNRSMDYWNIAYI